MGELSLIGPEARRVAGAGGARRRRARQRARRTSAGTPVVFVATDLGVDVFCAAEATESVRATLIAAGATEVSEAAAELVRVESGRPRYGVDLDENVIPQEAGLNERAVSFTKGCYVGQETVARLFYRGKPNRHLRGLKLSAPVEPGTPLLLGEKEVGRVTSVGRLARPRADRPGARAPRRPSPARRSRPATATSPPRSSSCRSRLARNSHCTLLRREYSRRDPVREGAADGRTRARPRQRHRQLG